MPKSPIYIIVFLLLIVGICGYEKIYQFDENEDIILSTTVYNTSGLQCISCSCNLTIYNPYPNETIINLSIYLYNKNNGIYSSPTLNLSYNKHIYPITLVCNDSSGFFGGDDRIGIKISETMFDYTAIIMSLIGVSIGFLVVSFKTNKEYKTIKKISFFSSIAFMLITIMTGFIVSDLSPSPSGIKIMLTIAIIIFILITLAITYFYGVERIDDDFTLMQR